MRCWTCLIFFYIVVGATGNSTDEWKEVKIAQGPVRGRRDPNGELWTFFNIPYATVPKGIYKFKAPLPPPTWTEPYDAVDKRIICPQPIVKMYMPGNYTMQEDCLVANVYVPDTEKKDLSVLVFFHGGGFQTEYGEWIQFKTVLKYKDFIVLTFNYRLGIIGFLCLGTEDIPGNAGMKDQVALLRWVQQNIAAFGGNPNDVTLAGYSSGSAAIDLIMLSKGDEGLFHKVFVESCAVLGSYMIQPDPLKIAKDYAALLNFSNVDDIYALEEFYKTLSIEGLTSVLFLNRTDSSYVFTPCIERDTGDETFLTISPMEILQQGDYKKMPMLYGFTNMEGLMHLAKFDNGWKTKMNENFSAFLPQNLKFETKDEKEEVANKIKHFYFGDKPVGEDNILRYIDFFTDGMIVYPILKEIKLHLEHGHDQMYLYEYSFVHEGIPYVPYTNKRGACHCDQTMTLADSKNFFYRLEPDDISEEYKNMKRIFRAIWHNFITTGKPVPEGSSLPEWPAVGVSRLPYMSLGQKVELRSKVLEDESYRFWDNIYEKYLRKPIPPPKRLLHRIQSSKNIMKYL